ncbi:MAG: rRNA pseudouridine synthase [Xanthomonadaceae bacterium]|nr:rRNA pseudouridine synthase [Xanthomonadaceae bacterium]
MIKKYPPGQVSLERALSKLGLASRTVGHKWILEGRVHVSGKVCKNPRQGVNPEKTKITIDGERATEQSFVCYILNKPKNTITSRSDEKGRKTIFSLITHDKPHLHSVGRLDYTTTGLIILTNDTRLSDWLTDPKNEVPRVYSVTARGEVTEEKLKKLRAQAHRVEPRKISSKESHLEITLTGGKNREVRNLMLSVGCEVTALKRISYGAAELKDLKTSEYKELTRDEVLVFFPDAQIKLSE